MQKKKRFGIVFSLLCIMLLPLFGYGQRSFNSPTIEIWLTQSELDTISGISNSEPIAIRLDNDGSLLVINDPGGSNGNFLDIDIASKTGTIVATEAQLDAGQAIPTGDLDVEGMVVTSGGSVVLLDIDGADELIRVDRSPLSVSNLVASAGARGLTIGTGDVLYFTEEVSLTGVNDGYVHMFAFPAGPKQTAATGAQIMAVTGMPGTIALQDPAFKAGKILVWDEAAFGGSDSIVGITNPGASPTINIEYASGFFPDGAAGLSAMAADSEGNLYLYNEFSASANPRFTIIRASDNAVFEVTEAAMLAATGLTDFDGSHACLAPVIDAQNRAVLYIAGAWATPTPCIIRFTFPAMVTPTPTVTPTPPGFTSVSANWTIYE